jgi:hypothetical protein
MWYSVKKYSGPSSRKTLWQVLSRPRPTKLDAETESNFHYSLDKSRNKERSDYFEVFVKEPNAYDKS